jgi:hypothetical protein
MAWLGSREKGAARRNQDTRGETADPNAEAVHSVRANRTAMPPIGELDQAGRGDEDIPPAARAPNF